MNRSGPLPFGIAADSLSPQPECGTATSSTGCSGCSVFQRATDSASASRSAPLYACHSTTESLRVSHAVSVQMPAASSAIIARGVRDAVATGALADAPHTARRIARQCSSWSVGSCITPRVRASLTPDVTGRIRGESRRLAPARCFFRRATISVRNAYPGPTPMADVYPQGPTAVPADLTRPSAAYRRHAYLAVAGLLVFVVLY